MQHKSMYYSTWCFVKSVYHYNAASIYPCFIHVTSACNIMYWVMCNFEIFFEANSQKLTVMSTFIKKEVISAKNKKSTVAITTTTTTTTTIIVIIIIEID